MNTFSIYLTDRTTLANVVGIVIIGESVQVTCLPITLQDGTMHVPIIVVPFATIGSIET